MKENLKKYRISFYWLEAAGPRSYEEVLAHDVGSAILKLKEKHNGSLLDIDDVELLEDKKSIGSDQPIFYQIPPDMWIKRTEHLPGVAHEMFKPSDEKYLVTDGYTIWIDNRHPDWWGRDTRHIITHWMPLPELPDREL